MPTRNIRVFPKIIISIWKTYEIWEKQNYEKKKNPQKKKDKKEEIRGTKATVCEKHSALF